MAIINIQRQDEKHPRRARIWAAGNNHGGDRVKGEDIRGQGGKWRVGQTSEAARWSVTDDSRALQTDGRTPSENSNTEPDEKTMSQSYLLTNLCAGNSSHLTALAVYCWGGGVWISHRIKSGLLLLFFYLIVNIFHRQVYLLPRMFCLCSEIVF